MGIAPPPTPLKPGPGHLSLLVSGQGHDAEQPF